MSKLSNLEYLQAVASKGDAGSEESRFRYPPAIARTLGFNLVEVGPATATVEILTDPEKHGNPMGTVHGGVLCDIADAAIGTAHATTLLEGESFTSIDLQINFFRPVWEDRVRAVAKPVNLGKTVSRYVCDIVGGGGKLVAQATSTVMTLRGGKAEGR
jgi:uncharacterized protein (TIGR00369 family)